MGEESVLSCWRADAELPADASEMRLQFRPILFRFCLLAKQRSIILNFEIHQSHKTFV